MKSRQVRSLAPEDLRLCQEGVQRVVELFRRLGYQVEDSLYPLSGEELELTPSNRAALKQAYLLADQGGLQVLLFELKEFDSTRFRAIAQDTLKRPGHYLLVAVPASDYSKLALINPRRFTGDRGSLKVKIHKLIIDTAHPTRHDLDTLEALAADGRSPEELYRAQCEAFDVERVTNDFYRGYAKLFRHLQEQIPAQNRGITQFRDPSYLHTFVQRLLGRIMFLYFLQKKGWLAEDQRFLTNWYRIIVGQNGNYYRDLLEPLFFETLNRRRPHDESPWGEIPYLNGGLFERDYGFLLYLSNDLFDPHGELSILGFFNSYNFTVEEDTPLELDVAVDPEMLGKVFENLLEEKERAKSGTFYTPRPIVHFMCRTALTEYLTDATGLPEAKIKELFEQGGEGEPGVSVAEANRIERALQAVKILDPAVGTAAFLVGMLHEMIALRRACERAKGVEIKPGSAKIAEWKREFIANNLYGVDIKPEAIEIAKLRLWLSLVVDLQRDQVEPLPNLDYKLMVGDSLIDTLDGQPILEITREQALIPTEVDRALEELQRLKDLYFTAESRERQELREQIQEQLERVVEAHVKQRIQELASQRRAIERKRDARTGKLPKRDQKRLEQLINLEGELAQVAAQVREGQFLPFLYQLYFNEVFKEKGGFDIVIANPPYVRHEKLDRKTQATFKQRYPHCYHGMADLYVYFYERAFQLLKPGGIFTFISSNKFFRAGYGKGLREFLRDHTTVLTVIDFGDRPVFDATTYPCIVLAKNEPPTDPDANEVWTLTITDLEEIAHLDEKLSGAPLILKQSDLAPEGWRLESPEILKLLAKIKQAGTPLGEYVQSKFYRGIVTGLNEAFVIDEATKEKLIAEDPKSAEIIKPFLRGKDIKRWRVDWQNLYLIFTRRGVDIERYPAIKAHLEQYKERLMPGSGRKPGNYRWYEIQDTIDYYAEFEKPKIVYPDIAKRCEFAYDSDSLYLDCTLFMIPKENPSLLGILNSKLINFFYQQISPHIRGDFMRFKTIYMERLPIVQASEPERQKIKELVEQILKAPSDPRVAQWEREIDEIVYRLYGLTEEEIRLVEEWYEQRTEENKGKSE